MKTTVETIEPYILESRDTIKLIVGHLMAVKAGETARLREALHEARALSDLSRRANFKKVAQISAGMECLIEAAEQEGRDKINETLEVLCDMCAHVVLYVDTVLLYADTVAMVIEFPWMRDALSRRLKHFSVAGMLDLDSAAEPAGADGPVVRLNGEDGPGDPEATLGQLRAALEEGQDSGTCVIDLSAVCEMPLWLLGTLMSYHVALQRQGRQMRLTGIRREAASGPVMQRLCEHFAVSPDVAEAV